MYINHKYGTKSSFTKLTHRYNHINNYINKYISNYNLEYYPETPFASHPISTLFRGRYYFELKNHGLVYLYTLCK